MTPNKVLDIAGEYIQARRDERGIHPKMDILSVLVVNLILDFI